MAIFSAIASAISSLAGAIGGTSAAAGTAAGGAAAASGGSALAGLSAVAGIAGTAFNVIGSMQQANGQKRAEELRLRQQNLEAQRARRNAFRQAQVAAATAQSTGVAQGADNSSGLAGGQFQIAGQAASNIQGINQGQSIGLDMFRANAQIAGGQTLQSIGNGIKSFGSFLADNYATGNRVAQNAFG